MKSALPLLCIALVGCTRVAKHENASLVPAASQIPVRVGDNLSGIDGTWIATQAELAGESLPPSVIKSIALRIAGVNYEVTVTTEKGPSFDRGTFALDQTTHPRAMTIAPVEGPLAGKTFFAIYEFDGNMMRICCDMSGATRPTAFMTTPNTKLYLVTYQRVRTKG